MNGFPRERIIRAWLPAAVAVAVGLAFLPAVNCAFVVWDDDAYVYENPLVTGGVSWAGTRRALDAIVCHHWAPLTIVSYQIDATLFGLQPAGFHLTNVLVHATAAGLLCLAVTRMTGKPYESAAATALFAMHPLRVESVAWISERKDVLAVLFLSLVLVAYEWHCRQPTRRRLAIVTGLMALGLLAKATLVTVPVLLLLTDIWPLRRVGSTGGPLSDTDDRNRFPATTWNRALLEKAPMFLLSAAFALATLLAQHEAIRTEEQMPLLATRLPNAVHALGWYLWKTVFPLHLMALYRHPGGQGWPFPALLQATACIAVACFLAWWFRRKVPAVPVGLGWFFVAVLPVLGVVAQAGQQAHADRCTYIPHIGLFWAIVWGASWMLELRRIPRPAAALCCLAILATYATLDREQIAVWRDSESLWKNVLARDPECPLACNNLGIFLHVANRNDEAVLFLERAVAGPHPDSRFVRNLAVVRAAAAMDTAAGTDPTDPSEPRALPR